MTSDYCPVTPRIAARRAVRVSPLIAMCIRLRPVVSRAARAKLIYRVYVVDPLICPRCQGATPACA
jgi:hypothetical protein